jgi:glycosyltransferase involved in cell wall biosynthesis
MSGRRVLMVAFHFPPLRGSSGFLRTLKFVRYLPRHGWSPVVLTAGVRAYAETDPGLMGQVPPEVPVHRSFALDAGRHLALRGRSPAFLRLPDRYATWIPGAVAAGLRLIRRHRVDAIFSTYPVPSAHCIGMALAALSGKPWVADFRDPMWDEYLEGTRLSIGLRKRIEAASMRRCRKAILATAGMREVFAARYPGLEGKLSVITNGYDEEDFRGIAEPEPATGGAVTFVHAGLLEKVDRNPIPFFRGLKLALERGAIPSGSLAVRLIGTGNHDEYAEELRRLGLAEVVRLQPPIPYHDALAAMAASDTLLLFQGPSCNAQIPAKAYEYLRIGKPILALTPAEGATGRLIGETASGRVVDPEDPEAIAAALARWIAEARKDGALPRADRATAARFSREKQAEALAARLAEALERC